jgi:hypothetical protein
MAIELGWQESNSSFVCTAHEKRLLAWHGQASEPISTWLGYEMHQAYRILRRNVFEKLT